MLGLVYVQYMQPREQVDVRGKFNKRCAEEIWELRWLATRWVFVGHATGLPFFEDGVGIWCDAVNEGRGGRGK